MTALAEDEILTTIECAALPGYGGSFEKVGHRRSLVISTVCLAALVKLDPTGRGFEQTIRRRIDEWRLARKKVTD